MNHQLTTSEIKLRIISLCLPEDLLILIDEVRINRRDYSRSNTIRQLILHSLASLSYLSPEQKKALGLKIISETEPSK